MVYCTYKIHEKMLAWEFADYTSGKQWGPLWTPFAALQRGWSAKVV